MKRSAPTPDSEAGDFFILDAPEWINVIALTPDRQIILVEQYRHGIDEVTLEIPGGMVDSDEEPQMSAERELAEETGYTADSWKYLGRVSSNPAIMNNFTHHYLAAGCRKTMDQKTGNFEDIHVHLIDLEDFMDFVGRGVIHHSVVLSAVARFLLLPDNRV